MDELPKEAKGAKNETNANMLKTQCEKILGMLPNSKIDEGTQESQETVRVKLFNLFNDFHVNMVEIAQRIENDRAKIQHTFFPGKLLQTANPPKIEMASSD